MGSIFRTEIGQIFAEIPKKSWHEKCKIFPRQTKEGMMNHDTGKSGPGAAAV
jgi:hypothetical protein